MNIYEATTEQLEEEIKRRKAVKPRATPESVKNIFSYYMGVGGDFMFACRRINYLLESLK